MGSQEARDEFVEQVRKACAFGKQLRDLGIRKGGVIRIDSAASPEAWVKDPAGSTKQIAETFRRACDVACGAARVTGQRRVGEHAEVEHRCLVLTVRK